MAVDLDSALEECLSARARGEPVEACLSQLPAEVRAEIEPLVRLVESVQQARQPRLPAATSAFQEQRLLSQVARLRAGEPVADSRPPRGGRISTLTPFPLGWRWMATALTLFLLVSSLLLGAGASALVSNAGPDDALYTWKLSWEQTQLLLSGTDAQRARVFLAIARHRIAEIERLAREGRPIPDELVLQLRLAVNQAINLAVMLSGREAIELLRQLAELLAFERHLLSRLLDTLPEPERASVELALATVAESEQSVARALEIQLQQDAPAPNATATSGPQATPEPQATSGPERTFGPPVTGPAALLLPGGGSAASAGPPIHADSASDAASIAALEPPANTSTGSTRDNWAAELTAAMDAAEDAQPAPVAENPPGEVESTHPEPLASSSVPQRRSNESSPPAFRLPSASSVAVGQPVVPDRALPSAGGTMDAIADGPPPAEDSAHTTGPTNGSAPGAAVQPVDDPPTPIASPPDDEDDDKKGDGKPESKQQGNGEGDQGPGEGHGAGGGQAGGPNDHANQGAGQGAAGGHGQGRDDQDDEKDKDDSGNSGGGEKVQKDDDDDEDDGGSSKAEKDKAEKGKSGGGDDKDEKRNDDSSNKDDKSKRRGSDDDDDDGGGKKERSDGKKSNSDPKQKRKN